MISRAIDVLARLPWRYMKHRLDALGRLFPAPWPEGHEVLIEGVQPAAIERRLRGGHWEGTEFAAHYEGEVAGVRRPDGVGPVGDHGARAPTELHARLRPRPGGTGVVVHREYSRYEAPGLHLDEHLEWLGEGEVRDLVDR